MTNDLEAFLREIHGANERVKKERRTQKTTKKSSLESPFGAVHFDYSIHYSEGGQVTVNTRDSKNKFSNTEEALFFFQRRIGSHTKNLAYFIHQELLLSS